MATIRNLHRVVINVLDTGVEVYGQVRYLDDQGFDGHLERRIPAPAIEADAETLVQSIITAAENALGVTLGRG